MATMINLTLIIVALLFFAGFFYRVYFKGIPQSKYPAEEE